MPRKSDWSIQAAHLSATAICTRDAAARPTSFTSVLAAKALAREKSLSDENEELVEDGPIPDYFT